MQFDTEYTIVTFPNGTHFSTMPPVVMYTLSVIDVYARSPNRDNPGVITQYTDYYFRL